MTVRIVSTSFDVRQGCVIVESATQEGVTSKAAKELAIKEAATRLHRVGFSGIPSPYPVNANGEITDDVILGREPVSAYRCDYKVQAGL